MKTLSRFAPAAAMLLVVGVLSAGGQQAAAPAGGTLPPPVKHDALIPEHGSYLGAWVLRAPDEKTSLGLLESQIGRPFAIGLHYVGWTKEWPNEEMQDDIAKGRIPLVSWNCENPNATVASGADDEIISSRARDARKFGHPIFLRWYWEFNVPGGQHTGKCLGMESPREKQQTDFIMAWRHIWQIFQKEGATNVVFVWNPNSTAPPGALDPKGFYPGDSYVDWIAWDKYDQIGGTPFEELFSDFIKGYGKMGKPLMIGETGAHPAFQRTFLEQATKALKGPYSQIKAFVYFDAPGHRPLPWTLSDEGIQALKVMGADPHFSPMAPSAKASK
jgi:hypothetical protein